MIKTRTITHAGRVVHRTGNGFQAAFRRHQYDAPNLKLMQTGKTLDRLIAIIIAGRLPAPFVTHMAIRGGSRFRHAKGHSARREMEPTAMRRANTGFHIIPDDPAPLALCVLGRRG